MVLRHIIPDIVFNRVVCECITNSIKKFDFPSLQKVFGMLIPLAVPIDEFCFVSLNRHINLMIFLYYSNFKRFHLKCFFIISQFSCMNMNWMFSVATFLTLSHCLGLKQ